MPNYDIFTVIEKTFRTASRQFGDPRYRPVLLNERWRRQNRTDTESKFVSSALGARVDNADMLMRTQGFDWYDHIADRPQSYIRNGPMLSVGELGHIAAGEYPWRTLYLQHPDRPVHSASTIIRDEVATQRRMGSLDWTIVDLFRTSDDERNVGRLNINTQGNVVGEQRVLDSAVLALLVGDATATQQSISDTMSRLLTTTNASGGSVASLGPKRVGIPTTLENSPIRPFFQIGELAAGSSRLFSLSAFITGESRSTVTYSVLRASPSDTTQVNRNYRSDMLVEQPFREISDSITTRGNVFRILYVGQAIRDIVRAGAKNGAVDGPEEIVSEFLGEAIVARDASFLPVASNPDAKGVSDSRFRLVAIRPVSQ